MYYILTRNTNETYLVDEEDYDYLMDFRWSEMNGRQNPYALRGIWNSETKSTKTIYLHREVLERKLGRPLQPGEYADHINGDTLDCRRSNLRVATPQQNSINSRQRGARSGFRGVASTRSNKFRAYHGATSIGTFDNASDAAKAYDEYMLALYGEYARTNFDNPFITIQ